MKVGMEAANASGLPREFISTVIDISKKLNIRIAIRCGQAPNIDKGYDVSPKPICVKTKTCNENHLPMLAGFIPWDQALFGRKYSKPIPERECKPVQLHVSLNEILRDAQRGEYNILSINENFLEFTAPMTNESIKNIVYVLDLKAGKEADPLFSNTKIQNNVTWNKNLGKLGQAANQLYPVFYKNQIEQMRPLNVAATPNNKPITGDVDFLWIAVPAAMASSEWHKTYNTTDPQQLRALLKKYFELCRTQTLAQFPNLLENIESFASTSGVITPYELLAEKLINEEFRKKIKHTCNLVQHGTDIHTPGEPSALVDILHIYKDKELYLTETEEELTNTVLQNDYVQNHYIPVHHRWNMEKWAPVVEKQMMLNQHLSLQVLTNYKRHLQNTWQDGNRCKNSNCKPISKNLVQCGFFHHHKRSPSKLQNTHEAMPRLVCGAN